MPKGQVCGISATQRVPGVGAVPASKKTSSARSALGMVSLLGRSKTKNSDFSCVLKASTVGQRCCKLRPYQEHIRLRQEHCGNHRTCASTQSSFQSTQAVTIFSLSSSKSSCPLHASIFLLEPVSKKLKAKLSMWMTCRMQR